MAVLFGVLCWRGSYLGFTVFGEQITPFGDVHMARPGGTMRAAKQRWCPGSELNRYVPFGTRDFKSRASASFATRAGLESLKKLYQFTRSGIREGVTVTTARKNQCRADAVIAPDSEVSACPFMDIRFRVRTLDSSARISLGV